jgi:hypothetical protein
VRLYISDVHQRASRALHPAYQLVKRFASEIGDLTEVWQLGDWFEFEYLASFNRENLKKLTEDTFEADYEVAERELDDWQAILGSEGLLMWFQGNHDRRVERLVERVPALEGLVEPEVRLQFAARGIKHVREEDQPRKVHEGRYALHGMFTTKYHAAAHLQAFMESVVYGHVHAEQSFAMRRPLDGKQIKAQSIGCLCGLQPEWRHGKPTKHGNGFALEDEDQLFPIGIENGQFRWGGELWSMTELERKLA